MQDKPNLIERIRRLLGKGPVHHWQLSHRDGVNPRSRTQTNRPHVRAAVSSPDYFPASDAAPVTFPAELLPGIQIRRINGVYIESV